MVRSQSPAAEGAGKIRFPCKAPRKNQTTDLAVFPSRVHPIQLLTSLPGPGDAGAKKRDGDILLADDRGQQGVARGSAGINLASHVTNVARQAHLELPGGHEQRSAEPEDQCGRTPRSSHCTRKNSGARGLTASLASGRKCGFCSAPWSRSSTQCQWSRCSTTLSSRWRNSWWKSFDSSSRVGRWVPSRFWTWLSTSRLSTCPRSSSRTSRREPQMVEQLVEVPTIVSFSSLQRIVDTPVPRRCGVEGQQGFLPGQSSSSSAGRGRSGGLQGFLPGQGSLQRTGEQIIDTPVRGRGVTRSLQGSPPRQGSSKRTAEQIADIPVPGGLRHGLSPDLHLAALPTVLPGELVQGGFRTFPQIQKKCTCRDASECEGAWALELIKSLMPVTLVTNWRTSRTKLACGCVCLQGAGTCSAQTRPSTATSLAEEYLECDMGRLLVFEAGWCWRVRCSFWSTLLWMQPMVVATERVHLSRASARRLLEVLVIPVCAVRTWNSGALILLFSSLYLAVIVCSSGCCLWSTVIGFSGDPGATRAQCLVRQWLHVLRQSWRFGTNYTHLLRRRGLGLRRFFLRSHAEWRSMLSRCFSLGPCTRFSPLKSGQHVHESMCWNLRDDEGHFSPPSAAFFGLLFRVEAIGYRVMPIHLDILWSYTSCLRARVRNNNNNTI